jgi:CspA family cold shock protein
MNFRDTLVTCQECGKQFVFTVEKQRQMFEKGIDAVIPDMCVACTQQLKYGGKQHGRIKWFSPDKGFGFIVQDDGSEVFVHRDGIVLNDEGHRPPLGERQEVLYSLIDTPRGPQAVKVTLYSEEG